MSHLTEEQFEDVVQGRTPAPAHVAECPACRDRVAEARAVRARLQASFASVHAGAGLADRLRRATVAEPRRTAKFLRLPRLAWAMAAAAAILVVAIPTVLYLTTPSAAAAAQRELVRIHTGNLSAQHDVLTGADPAQVAAYLKAQLGFDLATPRLGQGMAMRGCCVAHFKGQAVGSYVVQTPRGPISVIVVPQAPKDLGLTETFEAGGRTFWGGAFADNCIVATRLGGFTYCAVGEPAHDVLCEILLALGLGEQS